MGYTHHSFTKCDDCGTRHRVGNSTDCIETLKDRIKELEEVIEVLNEAAAGADI